ncbi:putative enzymatic polyprotein, partial [Mucuna pruriens]
MVSPIMVCDHVVWIHECPMISMDHMNRIFHPFLDKFIIVFIDDILVYSHNNEEHLKAIRDLKGE